MTYRDHTKNKLRERTMSLLCNHTGSSVLKTDLQQQQQ